MKIVKEKKDIVFVLYCMIIIGVLFLLIGKMIVYAYDRNFSNNDDWYLVCSGQNKDYLVKTETKPYTKNGFIYIGDEVFITPESGLTCKPVKGEVVRDAIEQQESQKSKK